MKKLEELKEFHVRDFIKEMEEMEANYTMWDKIGLFLYRKYHNTLDFFRYDLAQGLKNFWRYKGVIWRHRWYDYGFADDVVEEMYKDRAENWHRNHYVGGDKDERELKRIVGLFRKMREEDGLTATGDHEDVIRKEIYTLIARKRYWD